jgi:hypothetical protein
MLYKRSATKSYVSCENLLSLLQLLDLPVVSAVCCLSSTHTSAIDSRVTTFWQNQFVEHEVDTRISIIPGPFSRRLKTHYLQFFTTRLNYAVTFSASTLRRCFWLSKRWRNTEWREDHYIRILVTCTRYWMLSLLVKNVTARNSVFWGSYKQEHNTAPINSSRSYAETVLYLSFRSKEVYRLSLLDRTTRCIVLFCKV